MEILFPILAGSIAAAVAYLVASFRRKAQLEAWQRSADACGLTRVTTTEGGIVEGAALEGDAGDLRVRLGSYRRGKYERGTTIAVSGLGHGYGGLTLRREGLATAFEKGVLGEGEIELGDGSFDREVYVRGQAAMAFAALGPEARSPLNRLLAGKVAGGPGEPVSVSASLADGRLEVRVPESGFASGNRERLPAILARVLEVARPLAVRGELAPLVAGNLARERDAGVRLKALALLAREYPDHPATQERLRAALEDASDEVRLRAATALGTDGRETLRQLVTHAADDGCVSRAVTALGPQLDHELGEATLRRALAAGESRRDTLLACLEQQKRHGRHEAQPLVLEALAHADGAVVQAAARALGRIGDVGAVAPLLEAAARGQPAACRQAIAEIQSRLPGAGAGQLSIAAGEAGALSLADGETGQLSIADAEPAPAPAPAEEERRAAPPRPRIAE